jgi:hypothetical protein
VFRSFISKKKKKINEFNHNFKYVKNMMFFFLSGVVIGCTIVGVFVIVMVVLNIVILKRLVLMRYTYMCIIYLHVYNRLPFCTLVNCLGYLVINILYFEFQKRQCTYQLEDRIVCNQIFTVLTILQPVYLHPFLFSVEQHELTRRTT